MNKNMLDLIEKIEQDDGKLINKLIKMGMFTVEDVVREAIESKDAKLMYSTACYVEGVLIDKLADAIIETKDAEYIYNFARSVEGAPIDKLADAIIKTKDAMYIYFFAILVKGAPIGKLWRSIKEIGNKKYINLFYQEIISEYISARKIMDSDLHLYLTKEEGMKIFYELIKNEEYEVIENNKEYFRELFADTPEEEKNKPKVRVLKPSNEANN